MATSDEYANWIVSNADKKGTPEFDIVAKAYADSRTSAAPAEKPSKPFGEQVNDIPRQIGLTVRHGLKGAGNFVGIFSDPIGGVINTGIEAYDNARAPNVQELVTGKQRTPRMITAGGMADRLSDAIGLPKPADARERIVGDATEMMATGGGTAGLASKAASVVPGAAKTVLQNLAAKPLQQVVSAGASGFAGGYTRETGGNEGSQFLASLGAGVAVPAAMNKLQQAGTAGKNALNRLMNPQQAVPQQIDIQINQALQNSGMTLDQLPANIQNGIRQDVQAALNTNRSLSPDAVRRLADYRLTGATPTAGTLTLDPGIVSQQKNLAKLGINSKDAAAQQLGQVENANNARLIEGLNANGANTTLQPRAAGEQVMGALSAKNDQAGRIINKLYDRARATNGRSAGLDPSAFTQQANNLLDDALLGGKLPADVRNRLNMVATGEMPLTVDTAEQFKTRIGDLQRASSDKSERMALGLVRQSLDNTPLLDGQGQPAIDAFNRARKMNRAWMGVVDDTPALQAVRDGVEPDKFVQQFIVGNGGKANVADLAALRRSVQSDPAAMEVVRGQIAAHLKKAALNEAHDETGKFSQSAYNKALRQIGDDKLGMFFTPEQVNQLRAIGRVASYEQFQPVGSAVNNSNTAGSALATILDRIGSSPLLSKIPGGHWMSAPAQNISVGIGAKNALNVPNALAGPMVRQQAQNAPNALMLSPAAFIGNRKREE